MLILYSFSTSQIDGIEYHRVAEEAGKYKKDFEVLKIAKALLTEDKDYCAVAKAFWESVKNEVQSMPLILMGHDPIWLAVLLAVNLQTSFLTPPFGFSLFYLRGAAPAEVTTGMIYQGVAPYIALQLAVIALIWLAPGIATWLPRAVF